MRPCPAGFLQQGNLLAHKTRRRETEQEESNVEYEKSRFTPGFVERQTEGFFRVALLRRRLGRRGLAQEKVHDRPTDDHDQCCQHKQRVPPTVLRDNRANDHRHERTAEADSGIRDAERQAQLAIEPTTHNLQIPQRPEPDCGYGHKGP